MIALTIVQIQDFEIKVRVLKMSAKDKSISQKLRKCPAEKRAELIDVWLSAWQAEQSQLLRKLEQACYNDELAYQALSALHAITTKKFNGVKNIIKAISVDTRGI
jgi:hypothetical protein